MAREDANTSTRVRVDKEESKIDSVAEMGDFCAGGSEGARGVSGRMDGKEESMEGTFSHLCISSGVPSLVEGSALVGWTNKWGQITDFLAENQNMRTSSTACEDAVVDATLEPEAPSFSQLSCTERPPADFLRSASSRSWARMVSHFRRSFSAFSRCSADCARHA